MAGLSLAPLVDRFGEEALDVSIERVPWHFFC